MQIGTGGSPLSLAIFKALGGEQAAAGATQAPPLTTAEKAAAAAGGADAPKDAVPGATVKVPASACGDDGNSCNLPRGSFVDLRA